MLVEKLAPTKTTVLVTGESGTGKEVVARAIHAGSDRRDQPFVAINCGAIPEGLIESELFGHEKGSFTGAVGAKPGLFEVAGTGTLFLDEVGELPPPVQVKLLRALQERRIRRVGGNADIAISARIIAATNRDLEAEVKAGRFREDLFYRLNVIQLQMPPLRERRADMPAFLGFFLRRFAAELGRGEVAFSPDAVELLVAWQWPGNVRELANVVERAATLSEGPIIGAEVLPPRSGAPSCAARRPSSPPPGSTCRPTSTRWSEGCSSRRWSGPAATRPRRPSCSPSPSGASATASPSSGSAATDRRRSRGLIAGGAGLARLMPAVMELARGTSSQ